MRKIFILLCLGLLGCTTVVKESKVSSGFIKKPALVNEAEMDNVISVFSEAIRKDPNYAGAYYNRAIAYFYKNNYEQCWKDVHAAEALGCKFNVEFIQSLKKASNRDK
jgi:tetratricopeptide (TPR) repeat protein